MTELCQIETNFAIIFTKAHTIFFISRSPKKHLITKSAQNFQSHCLVHTSFSAFLTAFDSVDRKTRSFVPPKKCCKSSSRSAQANSHFSQHLVKKPSAAFNSLSVDTSRSIIDYPTTLYLDPERNFFHSAETSICIFLLKSKLVYSWTGHQNIKTSQHSQKMQLNEDVETVKIKA